MRTSVKSHGWGVACPDPRATSVAEAVLASGGNAVDAALAASAMLCVTMPDQTAPGGDAFWLVRAPDGEVVTIDGTGPNALGTPVPPERDAYADPRDARTVTVPGLVDTWRVARERFGSRGLPELFAPACALAADGFEMPPRLREAIRVHLADGEADAEFARVYGSQLHRETVRQPELAATLDALAADPRILYDGALAGAILACLAARGSHLSDEDLRGYRARFVTAVRHGFGEVELWEAPPPSQGSLVPFALAVREALPSDVEPEVDAHLWIECARAMMAVRDTALGDPASMDRPVEELWSPEIVAAFAAVLSADRRTARSELDVVVSRTVGRPRVGRPLGDTCHLAVVDADGTAVSLVQSVFWDFGSGIVVPGTGVILQNRGYEQRSDPEAVNCARPGRRPMHTLSAALLTDATGGLRGVLGCMGGHAQAQLHLQMLAALGGGADATKIVAAPRWFADPADPELPIRVERGFAHAESLRRLGHDVTVEPAGMDVFGHEQLILVAPDRLDAAADARSLGAAAVGPEPSG